MIQIIETLSEALKPKPQPWWQIFAIVGGTITGLLTAWVGYTTVKRRKGK